jgi:hypothetical protein
VQVTIERSGFGGMYIVESSLGSFISHERRSSTLIVEQYTGTVQYCTVTWLQLLSFVVDKTTLMGV